MKIEKISDNQIRFTLTGEDLAARQIKLSELAYGTEKARNLFREMMQQAAYQVGFEADNIPRMIEAIPMSEGSIVLVVTKVENPEELDTRFSRFSKTSEYDIDDDDEYMDDDDIDDDLDDNDESRDNNGTIARLEISGSGSVPQGVREALEGIFNTISGLAGTAGDFAAAANGSNTSSDDSTTGTAASTTGSTKESGSARESMCSLYIFDSLATNIRAAKQVASFYFSENCLYKNPSNGRYYLVLTNSNNTSQEFVRACNILAEYGTAQKLTYAMPAHFKEHFTAIMPEEALQTLSAL